MVASRSSREIIVNPKYHYLSGFIESIPDGWEHIGKTVYKERNEIKIISHEGFDINVKSYQIPHVVNKFAYAYFRKSKAKRSYLYAMKLNSLGVGTPDPLAYINCYERGVLKNSFFISIHLSDFSMTMRNVIGKKLEDKEAVLRQFTRFTYSGLIKNNVNHLDYSAGNTLIKKEEKAYQFSIVDINRMRFENMDLNRSLVMLSRLWADNEEVEIIGDEYAKITNENPKEVIKTLILLNEKHKRKIDRKQHFKEKLKRLFKL